MSGREGRGRGGRGRGDGVGGRRGRGGGSGRGADSGEAVASRHPIQADAPSSSSSADVLSPNLARQATVSDPPPLQTPAPPEVVTPAPAPDLPAAVPASSKAIVHARRPGFGTVGRKLMVRANHFFVSCADRKFCHYNVAITPEVISRTVNRSIIKELVRMYGDVNLASKRPVYDGRKSLYTAGELPFNSMEFLVKLPDRDPKRLREFKVVITFAGETTLYNLQQFLKGRQMEMPQDTIQALDVVMRESPSNNYVMVSRSFFSLNLGPSVDIQDGLECWRGYYQSLRPTQMGLSLNIDVSATSFYKSIPVIQFVKEFLHLKDTSRALSPVDCVKVKKVLRGLRVQTTHRGDSFRRYKITGITPLPLSQLKFPVDDSGKMMSVVLYFREKYNCSLMQTSWPCLQAGPDSRPVYLPMEVCDIVAGQRYMRKLNDKQVSNILKSTCKRPAERQQSIEEMVRHNAYNNDPYAREFSITVDSNMATVNARVLPPPKLKYHESGGEKMCNPTVGQWNMINKKMVDGGTVDSWTCISFSRPQNTVIGFCRDLVGKCNEIGMNFNPNPIVGIRTSRPDRIEEALRGLKNEVKQIFTSQGMDNKNLKLLIVVLPEMSGSYGKIKKLCETELGFVSQCCLPKHLARFNGQYLENLALKINVKVGGRNTVLLDALSRKIPLVTDVPTIVFGADVTHPHPGEDSSSSIAAVVASMDWPEVTKYRGLVSAQQHRQEMIQDLFTVKLDPKKGTTYGGMFRDLLIAFYKELRCKPQRIIFYRDGVSEGQFNEVLLFEMDAIRKACASLEDGYLPPVTFVVVQKRHHTRLFPADHGKRDTYDRSGNILPGTVVDTSICHPSEFDFYLCSHAGIQGTSRPTHYHVLLDENRFSADQLQTLTNNLCYTYARCTRSVSVVPPAYYAHLAAFRARYYTESESSDGASGPGRTAAGSQAIPAVVRPLPGIPECVKNVMFFC